MKYVTWQEWQKTLPELVEFLETRQQSREEPTIDEPRGKLKHPHAASALLNLKSFQKADNGEIEFVYITRHNARKIKKSSTQPTESNGEGASPAVKSFPDIITELKIAIEAVTAKNKNWMLRPCKGIQHGPKDLPKDGFVVILTPVGIVPPKGGDRGIQSPRRSALDDMIKTRTIRIGCLTWPPIMNTRVSQDRMTGAERVTARGLYSTLFDELKAQLNAEEPNGRRWTFQLVQLQAKHCEAALFNSEIDCPNPLRSREADVPMVHLVAGILETPRRLSYGDFICFTHLARIVGFAPKMPITDAEVEAGETLEFNSLSDLRGAGVKIGVVEDEAAHEVILSPLKIPEKNILKQNNFSAKALFPALLAGEYHVVFANGVIYENLAKNLKEQLTAVFEHVAVYPCGVMIPKKDGKLRNYLEGRLSRARHSDAFLKEEAMTIGPMREKGMVQSLYQSREFATK